MKIEEAACAREKLNSISRFCINPAIQHGGSIEKISRYNVIQVIILLSWYTSACSPQFSPC